MDVFKLAGPSDEDSESGPAEDSHSDDEWVMADSAEQEGSEEGSEEESEASEDSEDVLVLDDPGSELDTSPDEETLPAGAGKRPRGKAQGRKDSTAKGSKSVFASAEEFAHLIAAGKPVKMAKAKRTKRV